VESSTVENMDSVLKSWKEIADYLKAGVRTVQRWENLRGLPVYRTGGTRGAPVVGYRPELKAWLQSRGARKDQSRYRAEDIRQLVARHSLLLDELRHLIHVQGSMIAELKATDRALNKFCPVLAKGARPKRKHQIAELTTKTWEGHNHMEAGRS
jgi:hypothetical protein